ncbi:MAG: sigma-70 family RNA polymerase sigma factor, partial [Planctomycetaceae bacterium]|nr:sigma-70 family RNA polymerase sigma factor [Planctomycetaceae bacterium]
MTNRDDKTNRNPNHVSDLLDGLVCDGSFDHIGSRCKVPITDDDRHAAVVKALEAKDPEQFESKRHLANWMGTVMNNGSVDRYRKDQRQRSMPNTTLSQFLPDRPTSTQRELVWKCLKDLPETEQQILDAYYYDNCTDGELAELLYGSATPALSQRARRQRLKALDLLGEKLMG